MKTCPWCAEELPGIVSGTCPHCGASLPGAQSPAAGATPSSATAAPAPAAAGEAVYTHTGQRYVLGYDATDYVMRDRQAPGEDGRRFPRSDEGWRDAWLAFAALEPAAQPVGTPVATGAAATPAPSPLASPDPGAPGYAAPAGPSGSAPVTTPGVPAAVPPIARPPGKTNGMAVAALVTGILFIPIIPIVLGHIAKRDIDRSEGQQQGRGMAIAGLVMGWLGLGLIVLAIIAFGTFFAVFGDQFLDLVREDADARTLLNNAIVEVQDYGAQGSLADLSPAALEPSSVTWNTLPYPTDGEVSIHDPGEDEVVLVTRTELGLYYCATVDRWGHVVKGMQNAATPNECDDGWFFSLPSP